jgi:hypothetical protein
MTAGRLDERAGRRRMALGVAVLVLVSGWAATVIVAAPLRAELHARAERDLEDALAGEARGVAALIAGMRDVAAEVAGGSKIRDLLGEYAQGSATLESVAAATRPELEVALRQFPGLLGISRHGPRGNVVTQAGRPVPASPWPIPARMLDRAPEAGIVRIGNRSFLAVSTPITSAQGERIGTDVLLYDLDPMQNLLARVPDCAAGERFILGGRERERWWDLMLPPSGDGSNAVPDGSGLRAAMEAASQGDLGLLRPQDAEMRGRLLAYGRVSGQPWVLVLPADLARLYRHADARLMRWALPGLVLGLLLAALGWSLASGELDRGVRRRGAPQVRSDLASN